MGSELTAQDIKRIRGKYNLSQQAFARVLGIGEASIVRYENGQKPTRANANLIRAAENPSFMLDCLERDGDLLKPEQREKTEQIIYAEVTFNEKGDIMDINEIYELTLSQEILNEQAANMLADLFRMQDAAKKNGDEMLAMVYHDIAMQIVLAKRSLLYSENQSQLKFSEIRGNILGLMHFALTMEAKAA